MPSEKILKEKEAFVASLREKMESSVAGPFYFLLFFALPFPKCAPFPAALSVHGRAFSPRPLQIENRANACYTVT